MLTANDPAIGAVTRRQLRVLVAEGLLDQETLSLVERVLDKSRPKSSSGWCFLLAQALGAPCERAMEVASAVEILCSAIDFVDDVQDGDAKRYLGDVPMPIQVNVAVQMLTIFVLLIARQQYRGSWSSFNFQAEAMALLNAMGCGQRLELSRDAWSPAVYQRMAELTGGCQLEIYFRAAAWAAETEAAPFLELCEPLGFLLHMVNDRAAHDERLTRLCAAEMESRRRDASARLQRAAEAVPGEARPVIELLLRYAQGEDDNG